MGPVRGGRSRGPKEKEVKVRKSKKPGSQTCLFCGRVVIGNNVIYESHLNTHTKERPHFCKSCDSSFGSYSGLIQHNRNVHLGITFKCDRCGRPFNDHSNLYKHKKTCKATKVVQKWKPMGRRLGWVKDDVNGEGDGAENVTKRGRPRKAEVVVKKPKILGTRGRGRGRAKKVVGDVKAEVAGGVTGMRTGRKKMETRQKVKKEVQEEMVLYASQSEEKIKTPEKPVWTPKNSGFPANPNQSPELSEEAPIPEKLEFQETSDERNEEPKRKISKRRMTRKQVKKAHENEEGMIHASQGRGKGKPKTAEKPVESSIPVKPECEETSEEKKEEPKPKRKISRRRKPRQQMKEAPKNEEENENEEGMIHASQREEKIKAPEKPVETSKKLEVSSEKSEIAGNTNQPQESSVEEAPIIPESLECQETSEEKKEKPKRKISRRRKPRQQVKEAPKNEEENEEIVLHASQREEKIKAPENPVETPKKLEESPEKSDIEGNTSQPQESLVEEVPIPEKLECQETSEEKNEEPKRKISRRRMPRKISKKQNNKQEVVEPIDEEAGTKDKPKRARGARSTANTKRKLTDTETDDCNEKLETKKSENSSVEQNLVDKKADDDVQIEPQTQNEEKVEQAATPSVQAPVPTPPPRPSLSFLNVDPFKTFTPIPVDWYLRDDDDDDDDSPQKTPSAPPPWDPRFFLSNNRYIPDEETAPRPSVAPSAASSKVLASDPLKQDAAPEPPAKLKKRGRARKETGSLNPVAKKVTSLLSPEPEPFKCLTCGKGFSTKMKLSRHDKIHTGEKKFMCRFCDKRFLDKCNAVRHIAATHQTTVGKEGDPGSFLCPFCGEKYPSGTTGIVQLSKHITAKHSDQLI